VFRYDRQRDVEVTVKKLRKPAIFTFYTSNSTCGKCCQSVGDKNPKFRFRWEFYSLRVLSI